MDDVELVMPRVTQYPETRVPETPGPLVNPLQATELLATMIGGYNVGALIKLLSSNDSTIAEAAATTAVFASAKVEEVDTALEEASFLNTIRCCT